MIMCFKKLVTTHRNGELLKNKASLGIVDAQSVTKVDTGEKSVYDAGKKASGIKRH